MKWNGIVADTTDVDETPGVSAYQVNTRMKVDGELQRRHGMIAALPQVAGPILSIAGGNGFIVSAVEGGSVDGASDPVGVLIGPIVFPPVIQQFPQGNAWSVGLDGSAGANTGPVGASSCGVDQSCSGVIHIRRLAGRVSTGDYIVYRSTTQGGGDPNQFLVAIGSYGTEVGVTSISVPFSVAFPYVVYGVNDTYGPVMIYSEESHSDTGCSPEWTIFSDVGWSAITQVNAVNSYTCAPVGGKCPGRITLSLSSVTAPGATAQVWRHNNAGTTAIIDTRPIVTGSSYDVQIPSSTFGIELVYITVQINPNGGIVAGTITGRAKPGC